MSRDDFGIHLSDRAIRWVIAGGIAFLIGYPALGALIGFGVIKWQ